MVKDGKELNIIKKEKYILKVNIKKDLIIMMKIFGWDIYIKIQKL